MSNDNQNAIVNHLFDQILELRAENKTLKAIIDADTKTITNNDNQIAFDNILSELEILLLRRNEQDCNDALEADARLGRMVRNMPEECILAHKRYPLTMAFWEVHLATDSCSSYHKTPEEALESMMITDR